MAKIAATSCPDSRSLNASSSDVPAGRTLIRSWRIAGLYGFVALLWIYFSDHALEALVQDPALLIHIGMYKGIFFVLVTTFVLFLMMQRTFGETERNYLALKVSDDELRQAMTKLTRSEQRYKSTLDSSLQGCQIIGADWVYLYLNDVAVRQSRRPREELLGRTMLECWPGFSQTTVYEMLRRCLEERKPFQGETEFAFLDGGTGVFDVHAQPVPEGVFVLSIDVTDRRKSDMKLREQAALLDGARDAILVRDLEHHILYWNHGAERLYGWSAAEVAGRSIKELLYRDPAAFCEATAMVVEKGEWTGEIEQHTREGRAIIIEGRWTLMRDKDGCPQSIFAINTDVTERKKLEQQFLRAQRMESIGTLAGGIAHDLNNVLSPILMSIELLRMQEKDARRQNILSTIESSTKRGAEMVRQVLSFARGVEGRQMEVQPRHLLREIEKIVDETFLKTIRVSCDVPADLWTVTGDPTQLHQVLLNLCVNARDAMPEGGLLSLSAENMIVDESFAAMHGGAQAGLYVLFCVSDTGSGMSPEVVERIFEPFFTTKEVGKGTGLGLSTSMAIIKSHGGFVRVESETGKGTLFRVYVPAGVRGAHEQMHETGTAVELGKGELVLVVDDEAAVRQITRQTLEAFGYRVLLASDGAEASALFATRKDEIDVVITDMMMPVMDGPATIQVMKRMRPEIKIIGASGLNVAALTIKAAEAGAHCFIPKPFTAESLLLVIRRTLDGKPVS